MASVCRAQKQAQVSSWLWPSLIDDALRPHTVFLVGDAADLVDKSQEVNFRYVRFTAIFRLQESFYRHWSTAGIFLYGMS